MSILVFDLVRTISDLEGKNSKFRRIAFFLYDQKQHSNAFPALFYENCRKVHKNASNQPKNGNDLGDLDFDLEVMGVDLVHS